MLMEDQVSVKMKDFDEKKMEASIQYILNGKISINTQN